jgi:hypothetical protein
MRAVSPQGLKLFRPPGASLEPFVAAALSSFCDYTPFLMANFCTGFRKESLWVTSIFLNVFLLLIRLYPKEIHEEMEQREVRQCCAAARWSFEIAGAVRYVVRLTQWLPTLRLIQTYSDSIHWRELFLCNFYRALSWFFEGSSRCYMCLPVRFGWVLPRNRESMAMWVWDDESSEILAEPFHQCWKATDATA